MKQKARITKSDDYARRKTIQDWINKGFSNKTLHIFIEEKFGLKSYQARNKLINKVLEDISDSVDIETRRSINGERIESIIETCMNKGDISGTLKAIDLSNRLHSLYNDKKSIEITENYDIDF